MIALLKKILLGVMILSCLGCNQTSSQPDFSAIYISHTRVNSNKGIFKKVYDIDFSKYDMTLLGGDLGMNTFNPNKDKLLFPHLDSIFDFKSPNTLWSVGNHDETSDTRFYNKTNKNKYHAYQKNDITFITLNSQDSLSAIVGKQKDFLYSVLDTLHTSSVLIMTHKLIFMNDHPELDKQIHKVCNANKGSCHHCHNPNNFYPDIYPRLVRLKKEGKQIIWIGGDLGIKRTSFEYTDKSGIVFLGNGLGYNRTDNKVLLLHKGEKSHLDYEFVPIESLKKH